MEGKNQKKRNTRRPEINHQVKYQSDDSQQGRKTKEKKENGGNKIGAVDNNSFFLCFSCYFIGPSNLNWPGVLKPSKNTTWNEKQLAIVTKEKRKLKGKNYYWPDNNRR